ncbi:MAG TPA: sulfurtransferase TusA family protein [Anaerolineae bacterium]|nr:sulfurtransferase TusA family protein [Anaerolineae bacterium]HOQ97477.1 sulfurtransferase TusA family protein [Anaerolineae bacterium]HPL29647.1 sulfurtransferase TusA family protein [Anaerolineae bacterium]
MKGDVVLDARGQLCPMPIVNMARKIKEVQPGQVLEILADDEGAHSDVPAWCAKTGHEFLGEEGAEDHTRYFVRKVA